MDIENTPWRRARIRRSQSLQRDREKILRAESESRLLRMELGKFLGTLGAAAVAGLIGVMRATEDPGLLQDLLYPGFFAGITVAVAVLGMLSDVSGPHSPKYSKILRFYVYSLHFAAFGCLMIAVVMFANAVSNAELQEFFRSLPAPLPDATTDPA